MKRCKECGTWFRGEKALQRHIKAKHSQVETSEDDKGFTDHKKELLRTMNRVKESIKFRTKLMLIKRINKKLNKKVQTLQEQNELLKQRNKELNKTLDNVNKKLEKMLRSKKTEIDNGSTNNKHNNANRMPRQVSKTTTQHY